MLIFVCILEQKLAKHGKMLLYELACEFIYCKLELLHLRCLISKLWLAV